MKRWLAMNRWRLVALLACLVALRILMAIILALFVPDERLPVAARLTVAAVFEATLIALAIGVIGAFVQYNRIFNPRVPTE